MYTHAHTHAILVIVVMATSHSYSMKCQSIQAKKKKNPCTHSHCVSKKLRHTEVKRRLDAFRRHLGQSQSIFMSKSDFQSRMRIIKEQQLFIRAE